MTPEEIEESRRHAAAMTDRQLANLYVAGPDRWPPEAWEILVQEVTRRERARRVAQLMSSEPEDRPTGTSASAREAGAPEKSDAVAALLGFLLGPVGLWYKGQWAAGFAWLTVMLISTIAVGTWIAPLFWIGMAVHAARAETRS
jgi:hypothetical protein